MNDRRFSRPVSFMHHNHIRHVATAYEALECLDDLWGSLSCRELRAAYRACRDVLDGIRPAVDAERKFRSALSQAGLEMFQLPSSSTERKAAA